MAIAHLATEYVFSDFLLKEPTEPKFKGLRLELAVDKMVTCIAVGLPLLLISLAFAQEISIGKSRGAAQRPALGCVIEGCRVW
jgi:pannexin